jgi:hypothetical protein
VYPVIQHILLRLPSPGAALILPVAAAAVVCPAAAPPPPPVPPPHVIFRPVFLTADFAHYAGMAFRLKHPAAARHYLVTSHSLFGPAAHLDIQMTPDDIARVIVAAIGVSCTDPSELVIARPYVHVSHARPSDENGSGDDLALFEISSSSGGGAPALTLDPAPPVKGDRVWIFVKHPGKSVVAPEAAVIAWVSGGEIRYLIDDPGADLRGSTGAPLLSGDGHVLGIHLGTFTAKSGRLYGYACPGASIHRILEPGWTPPAFPLRPLP